MILRGRAAGAAGPEARKGPCPCVRHLYNNINSEIVSVCLSRSY